MSGEKAEETKAGKSGYKPVLGLSDEGEAAEPRDWREWAGKALEGSVFDQPEPAELMELTVIVPARNEEDCLGACLESLVSQSEDLFELGKDWELMVVDDHSADRTAEIARGFKGVTVLEAPKLEKGWTGKANAIWAAARRARGRWLLFTDADTIHEPGNLHRAMHEAARHKAGMLSYSPRQIVTGLARAGLCASFRTAGVVGRAVECEVCATLHPVAGRGMGAGPAVDTDAGALLQPRGQVELSLSGLPADAAGTAVVRGAALLQLVPAQNSEAGKLEGTHVRAVVFSCGVDEGRELLATRNSLLNP